MNRQYISGMRSVHFRGLLWAICVVLCMITPMRGHAAIEYPSQTAEFYVADYADLLSAENEQIIIRENEALRTQTDAQICVLTVESLDGDSIENYANETFRKWGIGDAKKNNGVLILVSKGDRKDRIEVGYGLEGDLTDALSADILRDGNAYLKDNDWESGIMTIYTEVAEKVHSVYDMEYTPGYVHTEDSDLENDPSAAGERNNAEADAESAEDGEPDLIDIIVGSKWFQIPVIILFAIVFIIRIFGEHGFFVRLLQIIFTVLFLGGCGLLVLGDGLDILPEFISVTGVGYMIVAGFNALLGMFFDGVGIGGGGYSGSSGSSGSDWFSGGGGGGSSGGGGASGSF